MKVLQVVISLIFLTNILFANNSNELRKKNSEAQIQWQNSLAKLLINKTTVDLKELIVLQRDIQLVNIKLRDEKYYYLLKNRPFQLVKTKGYNKWLNFEWNKNKEMEIYFHVRSI